MNDWNVVVTVNEHGFRQALRELPGFGAVHQTGFLNVLVMRVGNIERFLETLQGLMAENPERFTFLARAIPVTQTFNFESPEEFETKSGEAVLQWAPQLVGKRFHVRMHRRGFRGQLSSPEEERFLDKILLEAQEQAGNAGVITFDDPDAIIVVETLAGWCGLSCWTRDDLQRYPFLKLD